MFFVKEDNKVVMLIKITSFFCKMGLILLFKIQFLADPIMVEIIDSLINLRLDNFFVDIIFE